MTTERHDDAADAPGAAAGRWGLPAVVGLYALSVLLYALLGRRQDIPFVTPDEFTYGHLARSLADGDGFTWRGDPVHMRAALYVFLITPAWIVDNTITAYGVTKVLGALLLSTIVFPTWLLARRMLAPPLAFAVAGLALAGTWMTTASLVLTENLAFPLATASLAAAVTALRRPESRWAWAALALAGLAAWARFQLLLLLPVIGLALLLDVARAPRGERRARLVGHRLPLAAIGAVLLVTGIVALADFELVTGTYSGVEHFSPSLGKVLGHVGKSWLALFAMAGFIPIVVTVSLAASRRAWRDEDAGPLLCVLVPATVVFIAVSAWSTAGFRVPWPIQRYVEYLLPLAFVLVGLAGQRPGLLPRWSWLVGLGLGLLALLGPDAQSPLETRAYWTVAHGADQLFGLSAAPAIALAALVVTAGGLALLLGVRGRRSPRAALAVVGLLLAVVGLQAQAGWRWQLDRAQEWRSGFPADLRAVDHASGGPLARVFLTTSHPRFETVDFFNRNVTQVFAPEGRVENGRTLHGRRCVWSIDRAGRAHYEPGCGADPHRLYLDDPAAVLTYVNQSAVRRIRGLGRIVSVPAVGPTRLRSIAIMPCDDPTLVLPSGRVLGFAPRTCRAAFSAILFLDAPGTLAIGVRGGAEDHVAQVGTQGFRIPAGKVTTIRVKVPKGQSRLDMRFDTQELPKGLPDVASAVLTQDGRRQSIL